MIVSYSGIGLYNKCPSAFQRKYIEKEEGAKYIPAPAAERGTRLHNSIEDMLLGKRDTLPKELTGYQGFIEGLKEQGAKPEKKFCFGKGWEVVDFEDHENGMIRGLMDAVIPPKDGVVNVYEWKTGKEYDDHPFQRNLYGMVELILNPEVDTVIVTGVYLDHMINRRTVYPKNMLKTYQYLWERKINKTHPPQPYPMRPGWYCRGCPYSKGNGGKCPN